MSIQKRFNSKIKLGPILLYQKIRISTDKSSGRLVSVTERWGLNKRETVKYQTEHLSTELEGIGWTRLKLKVYTEVKAWPK